MSTTLAILEYLQGTPVAHAISKSDHLVGATSQLFHVFGFVILLAALVLVNLRLLGIALPEYSIPQLSRQPKQLIWAGLALAIISGTLMFIATPLLYFGNPAFRLKILLLLVAIVLQATLYRSVTRSESPSPVLARVSVAASVVLWFGVGLAGRAIGYV